MNQDQHLRQLLDEIAETEVPSGSLDLAARLRQRAATLQPAGPAARRGPRVLRPALASLCLLALLALGLNLLPGQTASVSAQEALRRAEQVTAFGLSGIRTLHGVMETVAPQSASVVREEIWVELPARLRKQTTWPPTRQSEAEAQTILTNGGDVWIWSVPASAPNAAPDSIGLIDPAELGTALYTVPNPSVSLDSSGEPAGLCAQSGDQLTLQGEAELLGRTALVVECRTAPSVHNGTTYPSERLKLWIDKQLFVVLQHEHYDSTGALFVRSRFSQFEVDVPIPAERFSFTPPSGVPIEDYRTPAQP